MSSSESITHGIRMLHQPLSDAAGDATSLQGQEAAHSCTKDLSQGLRSLCQQDAHLECLEAKALSRIRPKPSSPFRRKRHQLHGKMQEPEPDTAPRQDTRRQTNTAMVLGYCAAQGLT